MSPSEADGGGQFKMSGGGARAGSPTGNWGSETPLDGGGGLGQRLPRPMKQSALLFVAALLAFSSSALAASAPQLVKKWETAAELKTPESVLFDPAGKVLYVSNIDGKEPWGKDGAGSIAKVGLDGKIIAVEWVKGMNAPKGMGLVKDRLYVADIDRVMVIDVAL